MPSYQPVKITGYSTGLVEGREDFLLPEDSQTVLRNAYVWREKILRKNGCRLVGRLRRKNNTVALANTDGTDTFTSNALLTAILVNDPLATIESGSVVITIDAGNPNETIYNDATTAGVLTYVSGTYTGSGVVNYKTGDITITFTVTPPGGLTVSSNFNYFPNRPVMGDRTREVDNLNIEEYVFFDTRYAYIYNNGFQEWIPGTTWTGSNLQLFWTTNYWYSPNNLKIFWATNFNQNPGDPIRYTDGNAWIDFAPIISVEPGPINIRMNQALALIPFRGRLLAFRTWEGVDLATSQERFQRIRWAAIGNPISETSSIFPLAANVNDEAWRDDIRGRGGFLDIPTSQAITGIGFVRDNLVVYCERSTWQLRYTGSSIAPFQIERVNSELGSSSLFGNVQFDTSLMGIGDRGIVNCDSYKAERIDIKIPDLAFITTVIENDPQRIYGIRNFYRKLAYFSIPVPTSGETPNFPNRRLVYNYENDSWAIFEDSFTVFGFFQGFDDLTWEEAEMEWQEADFPWVSVPAQAALLTAGNQQGFVVELDALTVNEETLYISDITGADPAPTIITSPEHNLDTGQIIEIIGALGDFSDLNGVWMVSEIDDDTFNIFSYNESTLEFSDPNIHASGTYLGDAKIRVRDNFVIASKKFNFMDRGEAIQFGMLDILMDTTTNGAISLNILPDYSETPVNTLPQNTDLITNQPDPFFNITIPTTGPVNTERQFQRFYCPVRSSFLTFQYTLSNAQMNDDDAFRSEVIIHAQILWLRPAGKQLTYIEAS